MLLPWGVFACLLTVPAARCPDDAEADLCDADDDPAPGGGGGGGGGVQVGCPDDADVDLCDDDFTTDWTWPEDETWNTIQYSVCGAGTEQSPINLRVCDEIQDSTNSIVPTNWRQASDLVYSRGIQINMPTGTPLQTSMRGEMYTLLQCNLHVGSEHRFSSTQNVLSMQCVHSKDSVSQNSRTHGVLAFNWEIGAEDDFLTPWISLAPADGEAAVTADPLVDMNLAYADMNLAHYWQYDGSWTTPPCSEVVDWHVLMNTRTLSTAQHNTIKSKSGITDMTDGNFRLPQLLNGRQVLGCVSVQSEDYTETEDVSGASRAASSVFIFGVLVNLLIRLHVFP